MRFFNPCFSVISRTHSNARIHAQYSALLFVWFSKGKGSAILVLLSGWKKNNWKKSDGKPVLNKELIVKLDNLISNRLPLTTFVKVKAHLKKPTDQKMVWLWKGNFISDKLAEEGRMISEEK